ncbi:MAG: hypothetical protein LBQ55_07935 [Treponema sp.]|jgi:hypothetical protein|nr:hypothetical protein [Treponema sp.]
MDEEQDPTKKTETPREDGTVPRRPNAGHPLSPEKNTGEEMVFRYSRARRLERAPKKVRELYQPSPRKKFGFFRSLTATKPLAMLFGSVMVLSAITIVMAIYGGAENSRIMDGNRVSVTAMKYQGSTFVVLTKRRRDAKGAYTGPVDMAASPSAEKGGEEPLPVFENRLFFSLKAEEEFRFSIPFEAEELIVVLQNESSTADLRATPK